jgi:hypothetical protein
VVEHVERAIAVGNLKLDRVGGLGVVDRHRDVAVVGMPEQSDVETIAYAAVEFAWRRRDG